MAAGRRCTRRRGGDGARVGLWRGFPAGETKPAQPDRPRLRRGGAGHPLRGDGGEKVYIPLGPAGHRRQQREAVEAAIRDGVPIRDIIRRFGISRAGVYRARARLFRSPGKDYKPITSPPLRSS